MGRLRVRVLLGAYRRRVLRGAGTWPVWRALAPVAPRMLVERATVGPVASIGVAWAPAFNREERPLFAGVALQHYFSAVARAWVSDPLGCVTRRPIAVSALRADVDDLVQLPCGGVPAATHATVSGQWLPLVQAVGWQPGALVEDTREVFSF